MARLPFPERDITAPYGEMSAYRKAHKMQPHSGTDFAPAGSNRGNTKIPSVASGTVKLIQWSDILGWVIVQTAWDIKKKKTLYIGYCHIKCGTHGMNCKGPKVHGAHSPVRKKVGSKVKEGQIMAYIGNTGSASSGAHLHLTASWKVKGVFGVTADKFDFVEWVATQEGPQKKQADTKAKAVVLPKVCPTCKQTIK